MNTLPKQDAATPPEDSTIRLIPLTQGKFAIVDAADYEWLMQWKWRVIHPSSTLWYASGWQRRINKSVKGTTFYMHRILMSPPAGMVVDHIDGNGLNNRRSNLRVVTQQHNTLNRRMHKNNTSGYRGVHLVQLVSGNKWSASIEVMGKTIYLGQFTNKEDAAKAFTEAALRIHKGVLVTRQ